MNAHAKLDAPLRRQACVALDHAGLHFDGATDRVHHATKLNDRAVAGALDDAAVMSSDGGVNEVAAEAAKTRESSVFVDPSEPGIADDIRHKNRRQFPGFAHAHLRQAED
jgi:hypothetical protein